MVPTDRRFLMMTSRFVCSGWVLTRCLVLAVSIRRVISNRPKNKFYTSSNTATKSHPPIASESTILFRSVEKKGLQFGGLCNFSERYSVLADFAPNSALTRNNLATILCLHSGTESDGSCSFYFTCPAWVMYCHVLAPLLIQKPSNALYRPPPYPARVVQ